VYNYLFELTSAYLALTLWIQTYKHFTGTSIFFISWGREFSEYQKLQNNYV